jgi:hypothetical protein
MCYNLNVTAGGLQKKERTMFNLLGAVISTAIIAGMFFVVISPVLIN